ncbi:MAG: hypothetical protein EAX91_11920 [Candidatus Lokiarchaeota archaeon]|nr:hypothetical protein [Candidatus Lokiarchaeota archaeon]
MRIVNDENGGFEKLDVIKKYFHRIFTVLPKDVREQLLNLNLSKDELKEVKDELAFLSEEKQREFLKELAKKNQ